jgi:hypothetical protein
LRPTGSFENRKIAASRHHVDQALANEVLTADEERWLENAADLLFRTAEAAGAILLPPRDRLFIAMVNKRPVAGRHQRSTADQEGRGAALGKAVPSLVQRGTPAGCATASC